MKAERFWEETLDKPKIFAGVAVTKIKRPMQGIRPHISAAWYENDRTGRVTIALHGFGHLNPDDFAETLEQAQKEGTAP